MTSEERKLVAEALGCLRCWWLSEVGSDEGAGHVIRARELLRRVLEMGSEVRTLAEWHRLGQEVALEVGDGQV